MREVVPCPGCKDTLKNLAPVGQRCQTCKSGLMLRLAKKGKR